MKSIAKLIFEIGTLKRMKRAWLKNEGVSNPESVADHIYRTAVIGYLVAKMERADADKVMKMCLFHDIAEVRIGDIDKIAQRYIEKDEVEMKILEDQLKNLPFSVGEEAMDAVKEMSQKITKEAIIAKDADILELLFQAKEYADIGHTGCLYWIEKNSRFLKTESAKNILAELSSMNSTDWWKGLENLK